MPAPVCLITSAAIPVCASTADCPIIAAVVFLSTAALICPVFGIVDTTADVTPGVCVVATELFVATSAGAGAAGNAALALLFTLTSTPWPAIAHGA